MIPNYLKDFKFFYQHLGGKVFLMFSMNLLVAILDGLGLSMFLPLLNLVAGKSDVSAEAVGKIEYLIWIIQSIGIPYTLSGVLIFMCIFFLLKGLFVFIQGSYETYVQQKFIRRIRLDNIESLDSLSFKSFLESDIGQIQNTITGEVDRVSRAFASYFHSAQHVLMVLVYVGFAFLIDFQFALLVCLGGGVTNILFRQIYRRTKSTSVNITNLTNYFQGLIIQYVSNFKYLRLTGTIKSYSNKLDKLTGEIERSNFRIGVLSSVLKGVREPMIIIVVASVIIIQTELLQNPAGPILISLVFFYRALTSLMSMQTAWNYFLMNSGSLVNMDSFTRFLNNNREYKSKIKEADFKTEIKIKDVTFSYSDKIILNNISISIAKNSSVAFIGPSGSGKTTLISVIAGLMKPEKGEVLIDDLIIEDGDIKSIGVRVGYISQDPAIFNDSIFNNVTMWSEKTPQNIETFNRVVTDVSLTDFVDSLEGRENSVIGLSGLNVSGGQKQRIAIARELYKDIDLLILDEATSALDSESENVVHSSISKLQGKLTILIIAHRLSTIKDVDQIFLLKDGELKANGRYKDLLETEAEFKKMVEFQSL
jgi:ABC-type multidrug transport system fused ATPase/permease subunit